MKRRLFLIILSALMVFNVVAYATDLEIIYPNVNFRSTPAGRVICTFSGGEILTALDETWSDNQLWYHAHSDVYGDGYVSGEFARPVYADERAFDPEKPVESDYVTENAIAFYTSLYRYLYQFGFCYWDSAEGGCTFRVNNGVGDPSIVRPATKWDLAYMLLRYGLIVENEETTLLRNEDGSYEELLQVSSEVLRNHFGTDDVWEIIRNGLLNYSEVHAPHNVLSNNDYAQLVLVREQVDSEYCQKTTDWSDDTSADTNLVLFYNPDGGSRYHVDQNCPSTSTKYLPFTGSFTWAEINDAPYAELKPCSVCGAPAR